MYKKLLFLLVAIPLTYSSVYSSQTGDRFSPKDTQKPTNLNFFNDADISLVKTATLCSIAATAYCAKERSMNKDIIVPLIVATSVGAAVSATSSLIINGLKKIASYVSPSTRATTYFNQFSSSQISIVTGSLAALLYCYKNQ